MKRIDRYKKRWNGNKYVRTHRLIAEFVLGKPLPNKAEIHHINGGCDGPIVICQDRRYHCLLHVRQNAYSSCGNPHFRRCFICRKYDDPINLDTNNRHQICVNLRRRNQYKINRNAPLCECGCGRRVYKNQNKTQDNRDTWNRYVHGHNTTERNKYIKRGYLHETN